MRVVCGSVVCTIKAHLWCFTQFTVDHSKFAVNDRALSQPTSVTWSHFFYIMLYWGGFSGSFMFYRVYERAEDIFT